MKLQYDKVFCTCLYSGQEESYFDDGEAVAQLLQNNIVFINYEQGVIVNCNDIFAWAVADGERLENETEVEELYKLCMQYPTYGSVIWCCKKRNMQPQSPVAKRMKELNEWPIYLDRLQENSYDRYLKENKQHDSPRSN